MAAQDCSGPWGATMMGNAAASRFKQKTPSGPRLLRQVLLGLGGAAFLSVYYADMFGRGCDGWLTPYPWPYPAWAYGITLIKIGALLTWMGLRADPARGRPRTRGFLAGIFLVGAFHALACAYCNFVGLMWSWWTWSHVTLAFFVSFSYFVDANSAMPSDREDKGERLRGVLLGVAGATVLPATAEWLIFGPP